MPGARRLGPAGSGPQARRPLGGRSAVRARGAGGIRTRCPKIPGPRPYQLGRSAKNHLKYCWLQPHLTALHKIAAGGGKQEEGMRPGSRVHGDSLTSAGRTAATADGTPRLTE